MADEEIERWQLSLPKDIEKEKKATSSDGNELVARLGAAVCELYQAIIDRAAGRLPIQLFRKLERQYNYLRLWCDGYGLFTGELDEILAGSKRIRNRTLRLLMSLGRNLASKLLHHSILAEDIERALLRTSTRVRDLLEIAAFTLQEAESSDTDSDTSDDELYNGEVCSVDDMIEDISTDIQCLIDLGPRYEEPIRDKIKEEPAAQASRSVTWDPVEYLASRIRHRYPTGDNSLIQILGRSNWERTQRLYNTKEKNRLSSHQLKRKLEAESATLGSSEFYDSGLGRSIATPSSYAETVMSYHGSSGGSVRIPQLPLEAREGKYFDCIVCGERLNITKTNTWKKHVFRDLQPYICFKTDCKFNTAPFPDKEKWMKHIELDHGFPDSRDDISCPLCRLQIEGDKSSKINHLIAHLEEISLAVLPTNADPGDDSDSNKEDTNGEGDNDDEGLFIKLLDDPDYELGFNNLAQHNQENPLPKAGDGIPESDIATAPGYESLTANSSRTTPRNKPSLKVNIPDVPPSTASGYHYNGSEAALQFPGEVTLPCSPTAKSVLGNGGSSGPPNPFARPLVDSEKDPEKRGNSVTPVSALPSRFLKNGFLPSPSSFYPEWFVSGRDDTLPSPLNFATPVLATGPSFLLLDESDTNKKSKPETLHLGNIPVDGKDLSLILRSDQFLGTEVPVASSTKVKPTTLVAVLDTGCGGTLDNMQYKTADNTRFSPRSNSRPAVTSTSSPESIVTAQSTLTGQDCCEICGYRPKGDPQWFKGSMAKHKKLQHSTGPPKIYKCPFPGCKNQYKNRPDNLRQHQIELDHFVDNEDLRRPARFWCLYTPCPYTSRRESHRTRHMKRAHGYQEGDFGTTETPTEDNHLERPREKKGTTTALEALAEVAFG